VDELDPERRKIIFDPFARGRNRLCGRPADRRARRCVPAERPPAEGRATMIAWLTPGTFDTWLREVHRALKPNGVLGIEDHRAAPGTDPDQCATTGYLPEAWVIAKVEAAGFKLVARSDINANPKDTRDHPKGVWTLPPELYLGDVDREKYLAIGESDRMTLKFVKVADGAAR
jgi:predicted methyltransferase